MAKRTRGQIPSIENLSRNCSHISYVVERLFRCASAYFWKLLVGPGRLMVPLFGPLVGWLAGNRFLICPRIAY